jgi:imidazolonepropionase-like amidohydrolase
MFLYVLIGGFLSAGVLAQDKPPGGVLFENVRVFNGTSNQLSGPTNVLVVGNIIKTISSTPIADPAGVTVRRIQGNGRTLMPGLIDMHWHTMNIRLTPAAAMVAEVGYANLIAGADATEALMRGFTTVRDMGGPSFSLKRAIDEGIVAGPRIYPSGAMLSITSGHGDFRSSVELPRIVGGPLTRTEQVGQSFIIDSPDEMRLRAREQLLQGASQIKLTAGGGVTSPHSPLDAVTFTEAELRAAVEAASNWGTYVAAHAYSSAAVRAATAAGVRCIEHGHLMDEATAQLMAEKGIWLSMQPLPAELGEAFPPGSEERTKFDEVYAGTGRTYTLARKYKIKTAWGTDVLFSHALAQRQGALLATLTQWYTPAEALKMGTADNAQLLGLSGPRNPYKGKLGVVEEGALADLLLVEGDPIANINLIADPAKNFAVIMKDGKIYKHHEAVRTSTPNSAAGSRH